MSKNKITIYSSIQEANKADVESMLSMSEAERIEYFRALNIRVGLGDSDEEAQAAHQWWIQFINVEEKRDMTEEEYKNGPGNHSGA